MPTDASGTLQVTQVCTTENIFVSGNLVTSTQYCYRSQDVYIGFTIEALFATATIVGMVWIFKLIGGRKSIKP